VPWLLCCTCLGCHAEEGASMSAGLQRNRATFVNINRAEVSYEGPTKPSQCCSADALYGRKHTASATHIECCVCLSRTLRADSRLAVRRRSLRFSASVMLDCQHLPHISEGVQPFSLACHMSCSVLVMTRNRTQHSGDGRLSDLLQKTG